MTHNAASSTEGPTPRPAPARRRLTVDQYVHGVLGRQRTILSQVITLFESGRPDDRTLAQGVLTRLMPHAGQSIRLGITGVPGAGKSTLIERLGLNLISQGHRVAVLTVDPSSPVSGGCILGDKTRMTELSLDPNAFVRPSPSGSTLGGVARNTREAMLACEAAGYDIVIVETVGVGQSETAVVNMVDFFLAVLIAGAGDELQGIKRGLIEIVDMIAVNKADGDNRPRAQRAVAQYQNAMRLIHPADSPWTPPVIACSAIENAGLDAIWSEVLVHHTTLEHTGLFQDRRDEQLVRWMWDLVHDQMQRLLREDGSIRALSESLEAEILARRVPPSAASEQVLQALGRAIVALNRATSNGPLRHPGP